MVADARWVEGAAEGAGGRCDVGDGEGGLDALVGVAVVVGVGKVLGGRAGVVVGGKVDGVGVGGAGEGVEGVVERLEATSA